MAMSNRERVDKGLDALKRGLAPYVLRHMRHHYGGRLDDVLKREMYSQQLARMRQQGGGDEAFVEVADPDLLLKLMRVYYNEVFFDKLGHDARSYVGEVTSARHACAHHQSFTLDEAGRALDTIQRLLKAVSAGEEAAEVSGHHRAVQRQQFESDQRRDTREAAKQPSSEIPAASGLRPWREVVEPHPDVANGRYQEAEFAADLAEVLRGTADAEYQDPREFFRRTYLTDGMVSLLANSVGRVSGDGGDPVVQLQTVFGGGKTHSMLALYHLLSDEIRLDSIPDGEKIAEAADSRYIPNAERAVLVGTDLDPTKPREQDGITTRTLWGEMARQIGKAEGYDLVRDADERGISPGAETIKRLFDEHGPALVLIDELVAYMRNIYGDPDLPSGSFDSNMTFIQNLTEAAKRSETSLVVVSIPVSERAEEADRSDIETGGEAGRETVERLEQVIGRLESIWKPVGASESFEIVRRRLFSEDMNSAARDAVVDAYAKLYREHRSEYPSETAESDYERRLRSAYPIHPELFDRLYQDWSTLEKFQRTRGVLRLMAAVIHELWRRSDGSLMIMPGSVPLDAPKVCNQFVRYLPEGWNAVVDADIDGEESRPWALDGEHRNLGAVAASRRVARTVFVGSAPSVAGQQVRGVQEARVRLGCVQPSENAPLFADALHRLSEQLAYLYTDGGRYWYDTRPNVNREAADRAQQLDREDVHREIVRRLGDHTKSRGEFAGVHTAPSTSADVRDEPQARLVILPPDAAYRRSDENSEALRLSAQMLDHRGGSPRRFRNMLIFLAPDQRGVEALEESTRQYLAWDSILGEREQLNLDAYGVRQAEASKQRAAETTDARLDEAYRWLIYPAQEGTGPLEWTPLALGGGEGTLAARASRKLVGQDELVPRWSPASLNLELKRYLWPRDDDHVRLRQLAEQLATYPYLPRIKDENVLLEAVKDGIQSRDFFGYAHSVSEQGRYEGLQLGGLNAAVHLSPESVLVKPDAAARQQEEDERRQAEREKRRAYTEGPDGGNGEIKESGDGGEDGSSDTVTPEPVRDRFSGAVTLKPETISGKVGQIDEGILQHLASVFGSNVRVRLQIEADLPEGASDSLIFNVEENCGQLGFDSYGFEES